MRGILLELEADQAASQRRLARRLGIAVGLTNLLLRRIVANGWVQVVQIKRNQVRYLLTPSGVAAKAWLTRECLQSTLEFYREARQHVRERLAELSAALDATGGQKRLVFYGTGDIAEIGYVSLQETDLQLVAVIDAARGKPFFGVPVHSPDHLTADALSGLVFDRVVVMSFADAEITVSLQRAGVASHRVFWI
jgi:DNA-binding MarR family transcriptional regulator